MLNDGIAAPPKTVVIPKPDLDEVRQETSMDEDDPDGGEVMKIDQDLKDTGQAPNLKDDEIDTEPVDAPIKHAVENAVND